MEAAQGPGQWPPSMGQQQPGRLTCAAMAWLRARELLPPQFGKSDLGAENQERTVAMATWLPWGDHWGVLLYTLGVGLGHKDAKLPGPSSLLS